MRLDDDQPVGLERTQEPAEVAGIECEQRTQAYDVAALGPDLPEHACLAERPVPREEVVLERPDALGHEPVEAADSGDGVHRSLILVRDPHLRLTEWIHTPGDKRPTVTGVLAPASGLHAADVNIALGSLISLVTTERAAWLAKH